VDLSIDQPLRTSRLVLRGLVPGDAAALHAYRSLESVARYVPFEPMDVAEIERHLSERWSRRTIPGDGNGVVLGYERVDTGELIGDISLWVESAEHRGGEIGWTLHPAHQGHGFATEAAHGVLHLAFDALELHRVVARTDALNTASHRLCERLSMRREAVLVENEWFKGRWSDEIDYALLGREWGAMHAGEPGSCRWPLAPA
jgi:RimJ/RimL family protein N-acetyltransferase